MAFASKPQPTVAEMLQLHERCIVSEQALRQWLGDLPAEAQRISCISCVGLALDGASYLTRHSFQQIGERQPTVPAGLLQLGLVLRPQPGCYHPRSHLEGVQLLPIGLVHIRQLLPQKQVTHHSASLILEGLES